MKRCTTRTMRRTPWEQQQEMMVRMPSSRILDSEEFAQLDSVLDLLSHPPLIPSPASLLFLLIADLRFSNSCLLVLVYRWLHVLCWLELCSLCRTLRCEGFLSAPGTGTVLMSMPCTTQTPHARILLMQLRDMPRPTCTLIGGRLRYRFHE